MNKGDRRRSERDRGIRRVGRLSRLVIVAALAGTGILAAGFGNALHIPHPNLGRSDQQNGGTGLQGPVQNPTAPQGPPVTVSGGS